MDFALIIGVLVTICFLGYSVWAADGIPGSISKVYYHLEADGKGWIFQTSLIGLGMLLLPVWITASHPHIEWMAFLSCAGLCFVGAAPCFRLELEGAVHYAAAIVCCVSAVAWELMMGYYPIVITCAFLSWVMYLKNGNGMWWLELGVIGSVFASLI